MQFDPLLICALLAIGAVAGLLAGLLGVGGGLVIVPALALILPLAGLPLDHVMQVALGTSLCSMLATSPSSALSHARRGSVHVDAVRWLSPGLVLGALAGAQLAALLTSANLTLVVALFCLFAAAQMSLPQVGVHRERLPGAGVLAGFGLVIGALSALVGIGGGSLVVPLLVWYGLAPVRAVGTAAACGIPIAIAGTLGYVIGGWSLGAQLPDWSIGYVYLPAAALIAATSVLNAPLGARLAHRLPAQGLKRVFALLLVLIGARLLLRSFA